MGNRLHPIKLASLKQTPADAGLRCDLFCLKFPRSFQWGRMAKTSEIGREPLKGALKVSSSSKTMTRAREIRDEIVPGRVLQLSSARRGPVRRPCGRKSGNSTPVNLCVGWLVTFPSARHFSTSLRLASSCSLRDKISIIAIGKRIWSLLDLVIAQQRIAARLAGAEQTVVRAMD